MTPNIKLAREAADKLLLQFGLIEPPIDPEIMAEACGYKVLYANFEGDDAKKYSGFFRLDDNSILVNKEIPVNRITFTIAHEFGHAVLHQDYIKSNKYMPMPRTNWFSSGNKPIEEIEADHFAANLLVPLYMLKERRLGRNIDQLARLFFVSTDVIANRLDLLGRHPGLAKKPKQTEVLA